MSWNGFDRPDYIGTADRSSNLLPPPRPNIGQNHSGDSRINGYQSIPAASTNQRSYSAVNLNEQAHAILGDVNINAPNLAFLQNAGPGDQKRLLLRSLYFEQMNARKAQIDARASSPEYVEWVWRTNFVTWLEGPAAFYWITGKPGSGKSTLMTHVSCSSRTKDALRRNGKQWKIVRFFFDFRAVSSLANSIEGLIRSLLYQIIRQIPEVAEFIDHAQFSGNAVQWSLPKCLDNLREATEVSSYHICAFIDGLDEFEGSHSHLVEVIHTIRESVSGMKLCLASRPYLAFHEKFRNLDGLIMQDHNQESIDLYASAKWADRRIDHKTQLPQDLCRRIREKANGVFLWARLAVDELLIDFIAKKSTHELYAQLESMPGEVEAMYQRSLERMPEAHQQEAAAILYVLLQSEGKLPINKLYAVLAAMRTHGHVGQLILPIDCDADNSKRVFAILGDLTDQVLSDVIPSHRYKEDNPRCVPPRLVFENSTIKFRHDRTQCVALTHETLRAFLIKSTWLSSRVFCPIDFDEGSCPRFWLNIYLTEIASRMLTGPRDLSLLERIRTGSELYVAKLAEQGENDPDCDDFHEEHVVTLLSLWPNWSSLLLFAVLDMLDQLFHLKAGRCYLVSRILPLARSAFFPLHMAACVFDACKALFPFSSPGSDWVSEFMNDNNCAHRLKLQEFGIDPCYDPSSIEPAVIAALAHGLNDLVPPVIASFAMDILEKQRIFDLAWQINCSLSYISPPDDSAATIDSTHHLQFLIDEGCELTGRNICPLTNFGTICEPGRMDSFLQKNLSRDDLSHSTACEMHSSSNNIADHLADWELWELDGSDIIEVMIPILKDRDVSLSNFMNLSGENSVMSAILREHIAQGHSWVPNNSREYVQLMLDAGGDPYFKGESGNAFEVASMILERLRSKNKFELQESIIEMEDVVAILHEYAAGDSASTESLARGESNGHNSE